jgi:hypothetical protein
VLEVQNIVILLFSWILGSRFTFHKIQKAKVRSEIRMTVLLKTPAIGIRIDGDVGKPFLSHYLSRFASFSFKSSGTCSRISS